MSTLILIFMTKSVSPSLMTSVAIPVPVSVEVCQTQTVLEAKKKYATSSIVSVVSAQCIER